MAVGPHSPSMLTRSRPIVGVISLLGAIVAAGLAGFPGALNPGRGLLLVSLVAAYLVAVSAVALFSESLFQRLTPTIMILADLVWLALVYATTRLTLIASPLYLCIMAVAAAAVLDRFTLNVKSVILVVVLALGLIPQTPDAISLITNLIIHASVILGVSELVYRARTRGERLVAKVEDLSSKDALTALPNRRRLDEIMPEVVVRARARHAQVAGIVVDLDHFKEVNDRLGHAAGDAVLIQVARQLEAIGEREDTWVARLGGEEFVVLAVVDSPEAGWRLAERLHAGVATITDPVPITCSVGVTVLPPMPQTQTASAGGSWVWEILQSADAAMYRAKSSGRDQVCSEAELLTTAPRHTPDWSPVIRRNAATVRSVADFAPLPCPTPRHSDLAAEAARKQRIRARGMGMLATLATGAITLGVALQRYERPVMVLFVLSGIYLGTIAVIMFRRPALGVRLIPLTYLSGLLIWALLVNSQGQDQALIATAVAMFPVTASAAWMIDRWWLAAIFVAVPFALYGGLASGSLQGPDLIAKVAFDSCVIILVSALVHSLRRRGQILVEEVRTLSQTDALTGLANRRHLEDHARFLIENSRQEPDAQVAALLLDLDHFKQLNDTQGHAAGDLALRRAGEAVRAILGQDDAAARTGGEEILLLVKVRDRDEAMRRAEQVRSAIAHSGTGSAQQITCSIGVAMNQPALHEEDVARWNWELSASADRALYEAKARGRDQVVAVWDLQDPMSLSAAGAASGSGPRPLPGGLARQSSGPRPLGVTPDAKQAAATGLSSAARQ